MDHGKFIKEVQTRARLESREEAEHVTRVALECLAERLEHDIADNIAAQLPPELQRFLRTDVPFHRISLDDYYRRVQSREGNVDLPSARRHANCVIGVLEASIDPGAVEKLRTQFPADWEPLFSESGERELGERV